MSLEGKQYLVECVKKDLEEVLTVRQLETVMDVIWGSLSKVDVEAVQFEPNASASSDDLLQTFLQAKKVEGLSESSIKRYRYLICRFMEHTKIPLADTTVTHIREYYASEMERGICEVTIRGYQNTLSSMFGWLWREGLIRKNPCVNISAIKVPNLNKQPYSNVEIELLKEHCECLRDKAIVLFLLATGCRIEEATRVNISDVDFANKELIVFGKGKKERTVYLDDVAAAALKNYIASRDDDNPALFIGRFMERIKPGGVRRMLKRLEARSKVPNVHPHRFRRTLATNLSNKGMSIQEVAAILGHANINTTMKYVCVQKHSIKSHYQLYAA